MSEKSNLDYIFYTCKICGSFIPNILSGKEKGLYFVIN